MREIETCQVCENKKATFKYNFNTKLTHIDLNICDECANCLTLENESLNKYRNLERITPQKTLNLTRK